MKAAIVRWAFYLSALLLFGPLAGSLLGGLRSATGGSDATPLLSTTPALGILMAAAALLIALAVGAAAARLVGTMAGLTTAGLIVAWATWRTGTVDELVRTAQSGRPLVSLAIEGLIFGVLLVAMAYALRLAGGMENSARAERSAQPPKPKLGRWILAIPAGILAGGIAAAFLAGSPLKGQAVAAAIAGGVGAGVAIRLLSEQLGAAGKPALTAMFAAIAALAVLGPLSGVVMAGTGQGLVQATYKGTLFPLALITPLDWVAGALLGIPMGVSWAGSMMEKKA